MKHLSWQRVLNFTMLPMKGNWLNMAELNILHTQINNWDRRVENMEMLGSKISAWQ